MMLVTYHKLKGFDNLKHTTEDWIEEVMFFDDVCQKQL